ncbi:MAG: thiamine pyrophosphate-dependent enzyme [Clostridiaceae bacterium]|nr:thiamine pyrophosphate-dependent enzyme [Clostridiaceae bacterium]
MKVVYKKPETLTDASFTYCGGCGHGIINKILAEIIEEEKLAEKTVLIWPIGCSVYADQNFNVDSICALHGRAPSIATGMKRALPGNTIIAYQGDGDMVSEGMAEIIHAAVRGEKISVIFVNNAIFGMTGGQMAPTTLLEQKTATSPYGRKAATSGYPVHMAELISGLEGCYYSERVCVNNPKNITAAKKAIKKSIQYQSEGKGLSFVEVVSQCPTGWGVKPIESLNIVETEMTKEYPLGIYKDMGEEEK